MLQDEKEPQLRRLRDEFNAGKEIMKITSDINDLKRTFYTKVNLENSKARLSETLNKYSLSRSLTNPSVRTGVGPFSTRRPIGRCEEALQIHHKREQKGLNVSDGVSFPLLLSPPHRP